MVDLNNIGGFFSSINVGGIFDGLIKYSTYFFIAIFGAAAIFGFFWWRSRKNNKIQAIIEWHEEINDRLAWVREDTAEEISVPGTSLKLFYIPATDTWLFRFNRAVSPGRYYVAVTKNKEIVNFELGTILGNMKQAAIDFDHTDMRWAAENMREFVKRNYKDKGVVWWREYKDVITTAIYILIMTFSLVIIIYFMRGIVQDLGGVAGNIKEAVKMLNTCSVNQGSGLIVK